MPCEHFAARREAIAGQNQLAVSGKLETRKPRACDLTGLGPRRSRVPAAGKLEAGTIRGKLLTFQARPMTPEEKVAMRR